MTPVTGLMHAGFLMGRWHGCPLRLHAGNRGNGIVAEPLHGTEVRDARLDAGTARRRAVLRVTSRLPGNSVIPVDSFVYLLFDGGKERAGSPDSAPCRAAGIGAEIHPGFLARAGGILSLPTKSLYHSKKPLFARGAQSVRLSPNIRGDIRSKSGMPRERCLKYRPAGWRMGGMERDQQGESWICRTDPEYRTGRPMAVA